MRWRALLINIYKRFDDVMLRSRMCDFPPDFCKPHLFQPPQAVLANHEVFIYNGPLVFSARIPLTYLRDKGQLFCQVGLRTNWGRCMATTPTRKQFILRSPQHCPPATIYIGRLCALRAWKIRYSLCFCYRILLMTILPAWKFSRRKPCLHVQRFEKSLYTIRSSMGSIKDTGHQER